MCRPSWEMHRHRNVGWVHRQRGSGHWRNLSRISQWPRASIRQPYYYRLGQCSLPRSQGHGRTRKERGGSPWHPSFGTIAEKGHWYCQIQRENVPRKNSNIQTRNKTEILQRFNGEILCRVWPCGQEALNNALSYATDFIVDCETLWNKTCIVVVTGDFTSFNLYWILKISSSVAIFKHVLYLEIIPEKHSVMSNYKWHSSQKITVCRIIYLDMILHTPIYMEVEDLWILGVHKCTSDKRWVFKIVQLYFIDRKKKDNSFMLTSMR